jgi:hypothetical protein
VLLSNTFDASGQPVRTFVVEMRRESLLFNGFAAHE